MVLLGVIGAEFGQDITQENSKKKHGDERRKSSVVEGFGKTLTVLSIVTPYFCFTNQVWVIII